MAIATTAFTSAENAQESQLRWYVKDAIWAARIAVAIAILFATSAWPIYWQQLSFLIGLAILTYPVRAVRWGTIFNFVLIGCIWAFAIVGVQYLIEIVVLQNRAEVFRNVVIAAVTEEVLKVAPLLLVCSVGRWRFRHSYGACDFMLLGGALGAGFGLFENLLQGHPFPGTPISPQLFGWVLFPDSIGGFVGHGASSALIGLFIGYLVYALRWKRLVPFAVVLLLFAVVWMIVDHGMANYQVGQGDMLLLARWIWALDNRGTWTPYIFLGLIVATIAFERVVLFIVMRPFPRLGVVRCASTIFQPLRVGFGYPQLRSVVMRLNALFLYALAFRQLGYLGAHLKGDTRVDRRAISRSVLHRAFEVMSMQRAVKLS